MPAINTPPTSFISIMIKLQICHVDIYIRHNLRYHLFILDSWV